MSRWYSVLIRGNANLWHSSWCKIKYVRDSSESLWRTISSILLDNSALIIPSNSKSCSSATGPQLVHFPVSLDTLQNISASGTLLRQGILDSASPYSDMKWSHQNLRYTHWFEFRGSPKPQQASVESSKRGRKGDQYHCQSQEPGDIASLKNFEHCWW